MNVGSDSNYPAYANMPAETSGLLFGYQIASMARVYT